MVQDTPRTPRAATPLKGRFLRHLVRPKYALLLCVIFPLEASGEVTLNPLQAHRSPEQCGSEAVEARTYEYIMRGRVRLLFFWVGKDRVGGGHIALLKPVVARRSCPCEGVEIMFGSDPSRVPGQINRWGYGNEW